jgi:hypothetical protein
MSSSCGRKYSIGALDLLPSYRRDVLIATPGHRVADIAWNLLEEQQLIVVRRQIKRHRLRQFDRWLIGAFAGRFHLPFGRGSPATGWHRRAWRLLSLRRPPAVDTDLRDLLRRSGVRTQPEISKASRPGLAKLGHQVTPTSSSYSLDNFVGIVSASLDQQTTARGTELTNRAEGSH